MKSILNIFLFATVFFAACTNGNQQPEQTAQNSSEQH